MNLTHLNHFQNAISQTADDHTRNLLSWALILLGFASMIFAAVPELDLMVSRVFWEPAAGFVFTNEFLIGVRDFNRFLPWILIGSATALLIANPFLRQLKYRAAPHKLLFFLTFFAVGPGLSVHLIKMSVGRARPKALEEFGGKALFTPPWELTDHCVRHCSFISGEAASAFALLTLVVFINPRYWKLYLGAVGTVALAFSLNRVVFGAHFLSDVVIAWSVMFALAVLLWRMFSRNAPQIDAIFTRGSGLGQKPARHRLARTRADSDR
ncbi:MAG TPA: phosphatase PAP2 family protein [Pseudorhizobium sp.]|jgi:membrane-associated PAP2 superfamily phosphatase|nr:phosphatase PAP2 family protein [Pseudorhizobium sp.]